jgi:hypothetical protein
LAIVFYIMRERHVEDEVVEVLSSGDTAEMPTAPQPPSTTTQAEQEPET